VTKKTRGGDKKDTHNNTILITKKINKKEEAPNQNDSEDKSFFFSLVQELGFDPGKVKFFPARHKKLHDRLKMFKHDEIISAAKAIRANEYMQGDNPGKVKYGTIDYLLRNDQKLEEWVLRGPKAIDTTQRDADIAEEERRAEEFRRGNL
jgi:hypothetical protein